MCLGACRLTFLDFLINITYHDIPPLCYKTRLLLCYLPFLAYLGNPQSSQGTNIVSKHVFNKDPRVRRKESLPRIQKIAASIKVNCPMRLQRIYGSMKSTNPSSGG